MKNFLRISVIFLKPANKRKNFVFFKTTPVFASDIARELYKKFGGILPEQSIEKAAADWYTEM